MTDRPIIFSVPMIRALLDGRKTQTRRVLKPKWRDGANQQFTGWRAEQVGPRHWQIIGGMGVGANIKTPYATGDRLYVRESIARQETDQGVGYKTYAADGSNVWPLTQWYHQRKSIPSIHMPRWASRLTLTVTDVRVQRLQEISEADVLAEGCPCDPDYHDTTADGSNPHMVKIGSGKWRSPRAWYHELWNSLHGADAWDANPWVVAVSFSVHHGNIDQIGGPHD